MYNDFTLEVKADNGFNVLNRMINICNRRRVRIKSINAFEYEDDVRRGAASFVLHTTKEIAFKVKQQIDKLIEVETTSLTEGEDAADKESRKQFYALHQ
jgi:acetolactate synthase regulatory subunit